MITFKYGSQVSVLPASAVGKLDRATKKDIKVLFCLGASPELLSLCEADAAAAASACACTEAELAAALAFWRGAGVLESSEEEPLTVPEKEEKHEKKTKLSRDDELPQYTTDELTELLEKRKDTAQLINECQNVVGKIFNTHEVNIVLGLEDYLGLDGLFILTLCDFCVSIGKKSLRYIEKKAFGLYDDGVTTIDALSKHIENARKIADLEWQIRNLFGMGDRELTTKEKKFIDKWVNAFGYDMDIIKKAYEITVDAIHEPSPAYANAVLERFNKEGLKTLADIEAAIAEKLPGEGSFDTDDFFEAALRRSMEKMKG
ncbi:MAG: DnaD domain protein [Ruminococcaceae bacterium]|nr:DnaD domain protein [Oscillospiraceae bacterium]